MGFSGAYLAVQFLVSQIKVSSQAATRQTAAALLKLIQSDKFVKKRQSFFLYKAAACALMQVSKDTFHPLAGFCIFELQVLLVNSRGSKHRAISEALGTLPLNISGPDICTSKDKASSTISFHCLLNHYEDVDLTSFHWQGRTLTFNVKHNKMGCIKFAKSKQNEEELLNETQWFLHLKNKPPCKKSVFKIPTPVLIENNILLTLTNLPDFITSKIEIWNRYTAIAYIVEKEYFLYPNDPGLFRNHDTSILEVFKRNAWLLGCLASKGIIHTALIPLFHNRIQQARRNDGGLYLWEHGGRLDQWLESARYPNFAVSGLRDFEHLISIKTTKRLHHFIGEHLLGFVLVAGSFFRNKAPERKGFDAQGQPFDTRSLFDRKLFSNLIKHASVAYYEAMTGKRLKKIESVYKKRLIDNLIENMGSDHHMEEILRARDQCNMSDSEFDDFLISRGLSRSRLKGIKKGQKDIVLETGPHLGGFNQPISVPELMDFLFCLSSLCISDRYVMENGLKASLN